MKPTRLQNAFNRCIQAWDDARPFATKYAISSSGKTIKVYKCQARWTVGTATCAEVHAWHYLIVPPNELTYYNEWGRACDYVRWS